MMAAMWKPPLALLVGLVLLLPAWWPLAFAESDHSIFWGAGHLIVTGGTPYSNAEWIRLSSADPRSHVREMLEAAGAGQIWVYPAWTGLLFVPFGLLPRELGGWALHVSYVAASLLAVSGLISLAPWRRGGVSALAALVAITFQPLVIAARWGQFTSWVVLGGVLLMVATRREGVGRLLVPAILLAAKPQLGAIAGLVTLFQLVRRRAWKTIVSTAAGLAVFASAALVLDPGSLGNMLLGARQRVEAVDRFPTTWGFARATGAELWPLVAVGLIAISAVACVIAVRSARPAERDIVALGAALAFAVVLTPYALTYEHAVLVPVIVFAASAADRSRRGPRAALLSALVVLAAASWALLVIGRGGPALGILPVLFVTLFSASYLAARRWPDVPSDHGAPGPALSPSTDAAGGSASSTSMTGMPSRTG